MSGKGAYSGRPSNSFSKSAKHGSGGRPSQVGSILSASFASLGITAKLKEHNLKKIWAESVGESISKKTKPIKIVGTTLYCAVSSSPWMNELNYQKSEIITRINKKLGEGAVSAIIFRIGPVDEPSRSNASPAEPARALTEEEKDFIEKSAGKIKDGSLKALVKRIMEKSKS